MSDAKKISDVLRIAVAQFNPTVGDVNGNLAKARAARAEAARQGADLLLLTELFISGYPPEDLLLRPAFLQACADELAALGWSFAARKRLLEHFLIAGKEADAIDPTALDRTILTLRLPARDVRRLQDFARRELPKMTSRAAVIDRLEAALDTAIGGER